MCVFQFKICLLNKIIRTDETTCYFRMVGIRDELKYSGAECSEGCSEILLFLGLSDRFQHLNASNNLDLSPEVQALHKVSTTNFSILFCRIAQLFIPLFYCHCHRSLFVLVKSVKKQNLSSDCLTLIFLFNDAF